MKTILSLAILFVSFANPAFGEEAKYQVIVVEKSATFLDMPSRVLSNFSDQIALFIDINFSQKFPEVHRTRQFNQKKDFAVVMIQILNFFVRKPGEEEEFLNMDEEDPFHGGKRFVATISVVDGKTGRTLLPGFMVNYHDHVAGEEEESALLMDDTVCVIARQVAEIIGTSQWTP